MGLYVIFFVLEDKEEEDKIKHRKKSNIIRKLKRLLPGNSANIEGIVNQKGEHDRIICFEKRSVKIEQQFVVSESRQGLNRMPRIQ